MPSYWVAVASHEHVRRGLTGGFIQVCHGKPGPLRLMKGGDIIVYYSPTEHFREKSPCRKFTALGTIKKNEPYPFKMSDNFIPWRRDVSFLTAQEVPIEPLIENLSFIRDKKRWGFPFRRGCFSIPERDFRLIASAMGAEIA